MGTLAVAVASASAASAASAPAATASATLAAAFASVAAVIAIVFTPTDMPQAAANAQKLGADPSKGFIVGGTSAGGNISAVLGLLARDEKLSPPLTGLCLLIPSLIDFRDVPEEYKDEIVSYEQNQTAPILGQAEIDMFISHYKPDGKSKLWNVFTPPSDHSNLPATYFQVSGFLHAATSRLRPS